MADEPAGFDEFVADADVVLLDGTHYPFRSVHVTDLLPPGPLVVGEFIHDGTPFGALPPTDEGKPVTGVCLPFGVPDRTHEVDRTFENETRLH
jgi:hypothetical protein